MCLAIAEHWAELVQHLGNVFLGEVAKERFPFLLYMDPICPIQGTSLLFSGFILQQTDRTKQGFVQDSAVVACHCL